jgi:hypothetical protein
MIKFIGKKNEFSKRNSSTVYFEFDGRFFPHRDYTDFDKFIEIWSNDLTEIGSKDLITYFDGPYAFDVEEEEGVYIFRFYTRLEDGIEKTDECKCNKEEYMNLLNDLHEYARYLKSIN